MAQSSDSYRQKFRIFHPDDDADGRKLCLTIGKSASPNHDPEGAAAELIVSLQPPQQSPECDIKQIWHIVDDVSIVSESLDDNQKLKLCLDDPTRKRNIYVNRLINRKDLNLPVKFIPEEEKQIIDDSQTSAAVGDGEVMERQKTINSSSSDKTSSGMLMIDIRSASNLDRRDRLGPWRLEAVAMSDGSQMEDEEEEESKDQLPTSITEKGLFKVNSMPIKVETSKERVQKQSSESNITSGDRDSLSNSLKFSGIITHQSKQSDSFSKIEVIKPIGELALERQMVSQMTPPPKKKVLSKLKSDSDANLRTASKRGAQNGEHAPFGRQPLSDGEATIILDRSPPLKVSPAPQHQQVQTTVIQELPQAAEEEQKVIPSSRQAIYQKDQLALEGCDCFLDRPWKELREGRHHKEYFGQCCIFTKLFSFDSIDQTLQGTVESRRQRVDLWCRLLGITEGTIDVNRAKMEELADVKHVKLESKIHRDQVFKPQATEGESQTRYGLRIHSDDTNKDGSAVTKHKFPQDARKLEQLTTAWHLDKVAPGMEDADPKYFQDCTYILSALLIATDDDEVKAFSILQNLWNEKGLRRHFETGDPAQKFISGVAERFKKQESLWSKISTESFFGPEMFYENLYPRMASNFGFGGSIQSLPLQVCFNLLEMFIFFDDTDQEHLLDLIGHLLDKQQDKYMNLSPDNLQRYISNGKFVTAAFMDRDNYKEMVHDFLKKRFDEMQQAGQEGKRKKQGDGQKDKGGSLEEYKQPPFNKSKSVQQKAGSKSAFKIPTTSIMSTDSANSKKVSQKELSKVKKELGNLGQYFGFRF